MKGGGVLALLAVGGVLALVAIMSGGRAREAAGRPLEAPPIDGAEPRLLAMPISLTQPIAASAAREPPPSPGVPLLSPEVEVAPRSGVRVQDPLSVSEGPAMVVGPAAPAPAPMMAAPMMPAPVMAAPMMPAPMMPAPMMPAPMMPAPMMPAPMMPAPMTAAQDMAMASRSVGGDRAGAPADAVTMRSLKVGAALGPASPGTDPRAPAATFDMGPPPAPGLDPRPFAEAHWQGLEAVPKTPTLAQWLKLPADVAGVILDDVTLPADLQGFRAGDLVTAVDGVPTPNLVAFIRATERVRDQKQVAIDIVRSGAPQRLELVALLKRLGIANGETPPMIPPGAVRPHRYMGPCLNCHRIGMTGNLAADQGDNLKNAPGPVRLTDVSLHRDRGACAACHQILPP